MDIFLRGGGGRAHLLFFKKDVVFIKKLIQCKLSYNKSGIGVPKNCLVESKMPAAAQHFGLTSHPGDSSNTASHFILQ